VNYFKKGKNKLVIHLQGNPKFHLTGLFNANGYYLDDYNKILVETRDRTGIILIFLYLFVGAYHLFLFIKRRNEKYNLFFSLFTLFTFIYMLTRSGIFFEYGWDSTIVYRMELGSVYLIGPVLCLCSLSLLF
jgi:adenylate cyclase